MNNRTKPTIKQNNRHAHRKTPMFHIGHAYPGRMFEHDTKHMVYHIKRII
jgi:hypothetical protein